MTHDFGHRERARDEVVLDNGIPGLASCWYGAAHRLDVGVVSCARRRKLRPQVPVLLSNSAIEVPAVLILVVRPALIVTDLPVESIEAVRVMPVQA